MIPKLGRKQDQRKSLIRTQLVSLILYEELKTTDAKAKMLKNRFDRLFKIARQKNLSSFRLLLAQLDHRAATDKLISDIAQRNLARSSGQTRIFKLAGRSGDNAPMMLVKIIDRPKPIEKSATKNQAHKNHEADKVS